MPGKPAPTEFFKNAKKAGTGENSDLDGALRDPLPKFDMHKLYKPVKVSIKTTNDCKEHDNSQLFEVPQELVCRHSSWFRGAFEGRFAEDSEKSMSLEDVCPEVFQRFMAYLYTQDIVLHQGQDSTQDCSLSFLFEMYIFADQYGCRQFRQRVFETIQLTLARPLYLKVSTDEQPQFPNAELVKTLYENTTSSSPLRKFLVEFSLGLSVDHAAAANNEYPAEFLAECLVRSRRENNALWCAHCGIARDRKKCGDCCVHHEYADRMIGLDSDWCKFREHDTDEERRVCEWRKETMTTRLLGKTNQ